MSFLVACAIADRAHSLSQCLPDCFQPRKPVHFERQPRGENKIELRRRQPTFHFFLTAACSAGVSAAHWSSKSFFIFACEEMRKDLLQRGCPHAAQIRGS